MSYLPILSPLKLGIILFVLCKTRFSNESPNVCATTDVCGNDDGNRFRNPKIRAKPVFRRCISSRRGLWRKLRENRPGKSPRGSAQNELFVCTELELPSRPNIGLGPTYPAWKRSSQVRFQSFTTRFRTHNIPDGVLRKGNADDSISYSFIK